MIVRQHEGADPAAVLFDAIQMLKACCSTCLSWIPRAACRKAHLMEELKKMARVVGREWPEAEFRTLLVVDATTGQNGVEQARIFKDVAKLDGIILTKWTARPRAASPSRYVRSWACPCDISAWARA